MACTSSLFLFHAIPISGKLSDFPPPDNQVALEAATSHHYERVCDTAANNSALSRPIEATSSSFPGPPRQHCSITTDVVSRLLSDSRPILLAYAAVPSSPHPCHDNSSTTSKDFLDSTPTATATTAAVNNAARIRSSVLSVCDSSPQSCPRLHTPSAEPSSSQVISISAAAVLDRDNTIDVFIDHWAEPSHVLLSSFRHLYKYSASSSSRRHPGEPEGVIDPRHSPKASSSPSPTASSSTAERPSPHF